MSVLKNKSPYEKLYNKQPSLAHLRVIGCLAFATNLRRNDKFAPKARRDVLVGYAVRQKGYKFLEIESRIIFVSNDVIFHENEFPLKAPDLWEASDPELLVPYSHVEDSEHKLCSHQK